MERSTMAPKRENINSFSPNGVKPNALVYAIWAIPKLPIPAKKKSIFSCQIKRASPIHENIRPARIFRLYELAVPPDTPWRQTNQIRERMGRHLTKAAVTQGCSSGSQRMKYTHDIFRNGMRKGAMLRISLVSCVCVCVCVCTWKEIMKDEWEVWHETVYAGLPLVTIWATIVCVCMHEQLHSWFAYLSCVHLQPAYKLSAFERRLQHSQRFLHLRLGYSANPVL